MERRWLPICTRRLVLAGDLHQDLALARVVAARLLHVDVLARLGRQDRHRGVPVVRRRDQQRVHVLVFQHAAEVGLLLRGPALRLLGDRGGGREIAAIRVDHVLELDAGQRRELVDQLDAAPAAAGRAGAHAGDGEHDLVAGRRRPRRSARHQGDGRPGGDGGADELAAGDRVLHGADTTGIPEAKGWSPGVQVDAQGVELRQCAAQVGPRVLDPAGAEADRLATQPVLAGSRRGGGTRRAPRRTGSTPERAPPRPKPSSIARGTRSVPATSTSISKAPAVSRTTRRETSRCTSVCRRRARSPGSHAPSARRASDGRGW